jgi:cysteine desulfurase
VRRFYFDHNATTPISPELLEQYLPVLLEVFGNASSIHREGQAAKHTLETARKRCAELLGCGPREIVFVSGGTEANNLAIFGTLRRIGGDRKHVVSSLIEHPAVLNPCARLEKEGCEVTLVRPNSNGIVEPDAVRRAVRPDTALVSVMHVNNETGTIQPIAEISRIAREAGAVMHSDGVQAVGRIPVNVAVLGVDLYSVSGHKFHAPKGAGLLYVRKGIGLQPLLFGGRHEQERRAGTENVSGAAALGFAASEARSKLTTESQRLGNLRNRLEAGILERVEDVFVNGDRELRVPNTTNICFSGVEGEAMVIALDLKGFAVSSGSACSSGAVEPSHVLLAMGLSAEEARSSVRFSLGRSNGEEQVDALIDAVASAAAHLRKLSPVYSAHV